MVLLIFDENKKRLINNSKIYLHIFLTLKTSESFVFNLFLKLIITSKFKHIFLSVIFLNNVARLQQNKLEVCNKYLI